MTFRPPDAGPVPPPARLHLGPELTGARTARRFTEQALAAWGIPPDIVDCVRLIVTELVVNASLHARSGCDLTVASDGTRVRVEVGDDSPELPVPRAAGIAATTGRGLRIVDALASDWGVTLDGAHKVVWAEVALGAATPTSRS